MMDGGKLMPIFFFLSSFSPFIFLFVYLIVLPYNTHPYIHKRRKTQMTTQSRAHGKASANNNQYEGMSIDEQNILQKHVAFFDQNNDGIVYPWETFKGFREIGCGVLLSSVAALFINTGLSAKTRPGKCPSMLFPIEIKNIQKAKHGSDTGVYDSHGRFVASKFEELFKKHARTNPNYLTSDELMGMLKENRDPKDYAGWVASYSEWKMLYMLCKDKNGVLQKDTVRAVYDGSLFEQMANHKSSVS